MNKILFFVSISLILCAGVSCNKEDEKKKLSADPFTYREDGTAGTFTIKNSLDISSYAVYGKKARTYTVDGEIFGSDPGAGTEFRAGTLTVPADQNRFTYSAYEADHPPLMEVFGQETPYSLGNGNGQTFGVSLRGPLPLLMSLPLNAFDPEPVDLRKTMLMTWNADPENSEGIIVEISQSGKKDKYFRIADDGQLIFSSIWLQLPIKGSFTMSFYRGTRVTVTGSDSKKYVINIISKFYSDIYKI